MKKNISELLSSNKRKELILISFFACLSSLFLTTTIIFANLYIKITQRKFKAKRFLEEVPQASSDDRYIPVLSNMTEDAGALIYRGKHDINNSKYFKYIDIYNMNSSGSLILLNNFKTYQQTSDYSCGIASLIMAVYRINGTILNETDMSIRVGANEENGTLIADLERLVGELGFEYECKTTFNESTNPTRSEESFAEYIKDSDNGILISSHITTDLDHIADYLIFIDKRGFFRWFHAKSCWSIGSTKTDSHLAFQLGSYGNPLRMV